MNTMGEIFQKLSLNLMMASIMYLPKKLVELMFTDSDDPDASIFLESSNKIFVIEKNGHNYFLKDESPYIEILSKRSLLDSNILLLLNLKGDHTDLAFEFILENYRDQLYLFENASLWLKDNLKNNIESFSNNTFKSFELQHELYLNHIQEINHRFNNPLKRLNELALNIRNRNNGLTELKTILSPHKMKNIVLGKKIDNTAHFDKKSFMKELKNTTKREAEQFLLQSVFNVKFKS